MRATATDRDAGQKGRLSETPQPRNGILGGAACLVLSGAAALFYELVWTQQFSIVFGSSEIATASVLGVYLAGLGFGAALALRRCRSSRRPLLTYAALECAIALSALAVPWGLRHAQELLYRALATDGLPSASLGTSWLWQLLIAVLLLAVPTLCLGASFPYAIRGLVLSDAGAPRRTAWLYSANTFGAVSGGLAAGILVLPAVGIRTTTWIGAALSLAAAALAVLVWRRRSVGAPTATAPGELAVDRSFPFVPVVIVVGAVSLGSQILWTRLLIHFVGSGLYALSVLLATYLLGLTLGSMIAGVVGTSRRRNAAGFVVAQLWIAAVSWAAFAGLDLWAAGGRPAVMLFGERLLRTTVVSLLTLLPMGLGSGAAFLFAINARAGDAEAAAPTVALAYQLTAIGNLAGGLLLPLAVFPRVGFAGAQTLLVGLCLVAALLAARVAPSRRALCAAALALGAALLVVGPPDGHAILTHSPLTGSTDSDAVVFAEMGTSASVVLVERRGEWTLRTNGLTEGSIQPPGVARSRYLVPRWLGMLPFLARPEADDVLVIGLGAATTLEAIPAAVERVTVVEIERQVVDANRSLAGERATDPLADPRVEIVVNDARDVLNRTRRRFDVVVSQPSHPWTAGSANLYTREFFAAVAARLSPGGVLAQWVGLPFVDEALLRSLLATLADVFEHVEVYRPPTGAAFVLLASERPLDVGLPEALRPELVALGVGRREDVAAHWVLDTDGVRRLGEGAGLVTDDLNLLASRSPRVLGRALGRSLAHPVVAEHDPLPAASAALDRLALVQRVLPPARRELLARAEPDPTRRLLALTWLPGGDARRGRSALLTSVLQVEPGDEVARSALLRSSRPDLAGGAPPPGVLRGLTSEEAAVVDAWRAAARADWDGLRRLEGPLDELAPTESLFWESVLLRAQWRARSSARDDRIEALGLLDALMSHEATPGAILLYAVVAADAGLAVGALTALSDLSRVPSRLRDPSLDAAALALLRSRPFPPRFDEWVADLSVRFAS